MRLARFNVEVKEESSHEVFEGLPSPAAAGAIASFATAIPQISRFQGSGYPSWVQELSNRGLESAQYCLPMLAVILSGLMVSRVRYPHVFQQWFSGHRSPYQIGQMIFGAFIIFVFHEIAVPLIFLYFAFESPLRQWTLNRVAALRDVRDRPPYHTDAQLMDRSEKGNFTDVG
jgi:CDP-diacylglycerol--serine O-phosphatidyltransferase